MPMFHYVAMDVHGQETAGAIEGPSRNWVSERLAQEDLVPLDIEERATSVTLLDHIRQILPVGVTDLSLFSSQFALMIDTGLPILTALDLLADNTTKTRLKVALEETASSIRDGNSLHQSLQATTVFPDIYINMVKAGETGGTLVEVMRQLSSYLDREAELRGKVKSAMAYPLFLIVLATVVVTFLMVAIIPRFTQILDNLNVPLPLPTRILVAMSAFLVAHWPWILSAVGLTAIGIFVLFQREDFRRRLDTFLLKVPLAGDLVRKNSLARFGYVLGSLLAGGISIVDALEVAQATCGNRRLAIAIGEARKKVIGGKSISEALESTRAMPALLIQMVSIGEATGNLDQVLTRVSDIYDEQVDRVTATMVSMIEPALIVVLGGVVGFIALSLVLPMVKAVSAIGG